MVLVDTSVWIEHFRVSSPKLVDLLMAGGVLSHEFILGEISLAHFNKKDREKIVDRMSALERISTSAHEDVFEFARKNKFSGKGIGWIDSHILHSCLIHKVELWTFDKNLSALYKKLARK